MVIAHEHNKKISCALDIANIIQKILASECDIDREKEHLWVVGLKTNNTIKYIELSSLGILTGTIAHPREIFRFAIVQAVTSIIIVHNHPSGGVIAPSQKDKIFTKTILAAGVIIEITVFDHIIITADNYFSFSDNGLLC